jgi:hypothetical protein
MNACTLLIAVLLAGAAPGAPDGGGPTLDVAVRLASTKAPTLEVMLNSKDAKPLKHMPSALPWGNPYSMVLAAVRADTGTPIAASLPFACPLEEDVHVLPPGGRLTGTINLQSRFPELNDALLQHDVIVFWSYRLAVHDRGYTHREGGWVLIPRRDP